MMKSTLLVVTAAITLSGFTTTHASAWQLVPLASESEANPPILLVGAKRKKANRGHVQRRTNARLKAQIQPERNAAKEPTSLTCWDEPASGPTSCPSFESFCRLALGSDAAMSSNPDGSMTCTKASTPRNQD